MYLGNKNIQVLYTWLFAFFYAMALSMIFQKAVLPLLPALHAGLGLMKNDALLYHQSALILADNIRLHGWSAWSLWSAQTNTTGNVAVLSALYAIFSPNPALIIPVNAFFHATSAAMLLLIGRELWPGRVGNVAGLIAATLFIVFPSALSWYSQPLKDSYVIAGIVLIFFALIMILRPAPLKGDWLAAVFSFTAGVLLVAFVKPYYLKLLFLAILLAGCLVTIHTYWTKSPQRIRVLSFYGLAATILVAAMIFTKPYLFAYASGENYAGEVVVTPAGGKWNWQRSEWLPDLVEKNMEIAAKTRAGMIAFNQQVGAGSLIDEEKVPNSASKSFLYLPRALQVGLFAPFPDTWLQKISATRLLAVAETICWYLIAPGLIFALLYRRSLPMWLAIGFASFFLTIFSFVTPNIGTLYRYRYAFEFLLIVTALGGWLQFYLNWRERKREPAVGSIEGEPEIEIVVDQSKLVRPQQGFSKNKLISTALIVSLLTLIAYMGFFARDLFMIRSLGAGNELDIFFLGSMIPMFLISMISMPVGTSIIPVYTALLRSADRSAAINFIAGVWAYQTLFMAAISIVLYALSPLLFWMLGWQYSGEKLSEIQYVMNIYLLIMLLGGLIIIINSVLNAEGKLVFPAIAQLVVPVVAISSFVMFGPTYGIYAAAYGMLSGQIANLILVMIALGNRGLPNLLKPDLTLVRQNFPFDQYSIFVAVALSTALYVPLANTIAAHLPAGSVAIIGMGIKFVMLITGVIGMGITTVLLPYFSNLAARSHHLKAQADLSLFLLLATVVSVPLALGLRLVAAALTYRLVAGSTMADTDINEMIRTIQYGIAQLPFFVCSLIAIKYISAYQRTGILILSSVIGLVLTILISLILVGYIHVSGISLAMTIALVFSTTILVWYVGHLKHLPIYDSILIFVNWIVFVALFVGLHFHMIKGLIVLGVVYLLLTIANWKKLISGWTDKGVSELKEQPE